MRCVRAILIAAIATVALVSPALAQWPTTCVELNDIVEAHLGNHENVGIYERVFGGQAEQACQNDHREDVLSVFAWAVGGLELQTGQLAWPTSCVELNDIVESHLGNVGNVGIYQRVFGADAEAACRNDHRDDVLSVFEWAFAGLSSVPSSTAIQEDRYVYILRGKFTDRPERDLIYEFFMSCGQQTNHLFESKEEAAENATVQVLEFGGAAGIWWFESCPEDTTGLLHDLPALGQDVNQHPSYRTIVDEAIRRGASPDSAEQIAASVIERGTVDQFLDGTDPGVEYGTTEDGDIENGGTSQRDGDSTTTGTSSVGSVTCESYSADGGNTSGVRCYDSGALISHTWCTSYTADGENTSGVRCYDDGDLVSHTWCTSYQSGNTSGVRCYDMGTQVSHTWCRSNPDFTVTCGEE